MYLDKRMYVKNWSWMKPEDRHTVTVLKNGKQCIEGERVKYVIEEAAYWRKANAIHQWFVENVQGGNDDCKEYYVSQERLAELLGLVRKVLKAPKLASKLLPTQAGFFFGSTEYGEWYFDDLKETERMLDAALRETDDMSEFYYQSSW